MKTLLASALLIAPAAYADPAASTGPAADDGPAIASADIYVYAAHGQSDLLPTRPAQVNARLPILIDVFVYVFGFSLPHALSQ